MTNVNGYGIPDNINTVYTVDAAVPEQLTFPRWDGAAWVSDESAYATQADAEAATKKVAVSAQRAAAYIAESDPIFFKAQRGEATMEEWQAKVAEIKQRFPLPA